MDRFGPDQVDRELGAWLRDESSTRAPGGLVEGVFARTSRTRQASRWWPPDGEWLRDLLGSLRPPNQSRLGVRRLGGRRAWQGLSTLAGRAHSSGRRSR